MSKKTAFISSQCVACGCCEKECPLHAITIWNGVHARVDDNLCVGCGKCVKICPACVITIKHKEEKSNEKTLE